MQALEGIPGVKHTSDDIIVFGKENTQKEAQTPHDICLRLAMDRLSDKNLTLQGEKCLFNKEILEFYGHIFGHQGMSPAPEKNKRNKRV